MSWSTDEVSGETNEEKRRRLRNAFGRMESLDKLERTDDALTLLFQRRHFDIGSYPEPVQQETARRRRTVQDPETQRVIDNVTKLNAKIRKMRLYKADEDEDERDKKTEKMEQSKRRRVRESRKKALQEAEKEEDVPKEDDDREDPKEVKIPTSEPCDHRGVPLSNPMAITPYPGASTAAQRAKARLLLKELAIRMREEQEAKERAVAMEKELEKYEKKSAESSSKRTKRSRSSNSDSSSRSLRSLRSSRSSKSSKSSKASKSSKSSRASTSLRTLLSSRASRASKASRSRRHCEECGSCRKCAQKCNENHFLITDREREKFYRSINELRKKLIKPEISREYSKISPYDVTQSSSEATLRERIKEARKKKRRGLVI